MKALCCKLFRTRVRLPPPPPITKSVTVKDLRNTTSFCTVIDLWGTTPHGRSQAGRETGLSFRSSDLIYFQLLALG